MNEQKNLLAAIALSFAGLLGFNYFTFSPKPTSQLTESTKQTSVPSEAPSLQSIEEPKKSEPVSRSQALTEQPRIRINTPKIHGSINLMGARLDDITLADYHETTDPKSP